MANGHFYVVNLGPTALSAITTLIQIKTGAATPAELVRAQVTETLSVTSTKQRVSLTRKSAAATVTAFTPLLYFGSDPAAAAVGGIAATGTNASAEGTDGDLLIQDTFNFLSPWIYLPVPEERHLIAAAGIYGLKLPVAPASGTFMGQLVFSERS